MAAVDCDTAKEGRALAAKRQGGSEATAATRKPLVEEIDGSLARRRSQGASRSKLSETRERRGARASTLLKKRLDCEGDFIELKPRLAAGGRLQTRGLFAPSEVSRLLALDARLSELETLGRALWRGSDN